MNAVNLLPKESRKRAVSLPTSPQTLGLIGGLLLALVAAVLFVSAHNKVSARRSELTKVTAGVAQWQVAGNSYAAYVQTAKQRTQDLAIVRQLAGSRFPWSRLLSQIGGVMPKDAALTSLTATAPGTGAGDSSTASTGTAATPAIQLTGCATSQSAVAQTLVQLHAVHGVSDVMLGSSTSDGSGTSSAGSGAAGGGNCPLNLKSPVQFQVSMTFADSSATASATSTTATTSTTSTTPTTSTPAATASAATGSSSTPSAQ